MPRPVAVTICFPGSWEQNAAFIDTAIKMIQGQGQIKAIYYEIHGTVHQLEFYIRRFE